MELPVTPIAWTIFLSLVSLAAAGMFGALRQIVRYPSSVRGPAGTSRTRAPSPGAEALRPSTGAPGHPRRQATPHPAAASPQATRT